MNSSPEEGVVLARVTDELDRNACLRPLSGDAAERRLWDDHDLASMAENRLGASVDPARLGEEERRFLHATAILDGERSAARYADYYRSYWIVENGKRVGTLAVATSLLGRSTVDVSSLYVTAARRGRGHATRALEAAYTASLAAGLTGIRLSTEWSWQPAVRFYLNLGLWVWGWKHSLVFLRRSDLPPWQVLVDGDRARFVASDGDAERTLIQAQRVDDRLRWFEAPPGEPPSNDELSFYAPGTFALALAVRGFPLITSDDAWRAQLAAGFSDGGGPEGLAFKIGRFEAWDRKCGWLTPAPRIPGLDYPDWDEH